MSETVILVRSLVNVNCSDKEHQLLLKMCEEQQALVNVNGKQLQRLVADANRRLNELELRSSGLQLLKILLIQCPNRVLKTNWMFWMKKCWKAAEDTRFSDEAYDVLCVLIETLHSLFPTVSLSKSIQKVLKYILNTSRISPAQLRCLEILLGFYGIDCKAKVGNIQRFLLKFVDEEEGILVEGASRCISYLPLLLAVADNEDDCSWGEMQNKLCATSSLMMNELFTNVHEIPETSSPFNLYVGFQFEAIQESNVLGIYKKANRLKNILIFIERMLIDDFDNAKAVYADALIAMAQRIVEVNLQTLSCGDTEEDVALMTVLPEIQASAFKLLRTSLCWDLNGLHKSAPMFGKLIRQTLKWTSCGQRVEHSFRC